MQDDYFNIIRPYVKSMIDNHKAHGEWKTQLAMQIKFVSSLATDKFRIIYTQSDNVETLIGTETDDVINELFKSFFQKYQEGLQKKMKESEFVFDSVDLLYYRLHKIYLNRGG